MKQASSVYFDIAQIHLFISYDALKHSITDSGKDSIH